MLFFQCLIFPISFQWFNQCYLIKLTPKGYDYLYRYPFPILQKRTVRHRAMNHRQGFKPERPVPSIYQKPRDRGRNGQNPAISPSSEPNLVARKESVFLPPFKGISQKFTRHSVFRIPWSTKVQRTAQGENLSKGIHSHLCKCKSSHCFCA